MAKFFYDTEFVEVGPKYPVQLISIGIVCDDGREFYRQSCEYDDELVNNWVKANVIPKLEGCSSGVGKEFHRDGKCGHADCPWYTNAQIRDGVRKFIALSIGKPSLVGYYSSYDHIVFCQLFGTMADLPNGYPMYTFDIKQWCDMLGNPLLPEKPKNDHNALDDAKWTKKAYEFLEEFSKKQQKDIKLHSNRTTKDG